MIIPPLVALLAWIPISLLFFRFYSMRQALLLNFIGGWALLPAANYHNPGVAFPYWILGTSLESDYFLTKATVIGLTGLLGVLLFDRRAFQRFELTVWDLPMGMWLAAPLLSAIANPGHYVEGFTGEAYQVLAWGSPYLIGRLYFTDTQSLRMAAKGFVIGGLAYIPICIVEFFKGPFLYARLYGYQPFRFQGEHRFIGYRPIGLLENGNQLGIWMATATLIALWLWHRRTATKILGIPMLLVAVALFAVTLLCQSLGAVLLLVALIPFVFIDPRHLSRTVSIVLVLGILAFAAFRIANVVSLQELVKRNPTAHAVASYLKKIGKGSFGWRLEQDERHINTALEEPILGYGQWNWWGKQLYFATTEGWQKDHPIGRPWGLWLLTFGMYGAVGLLALEALLLIPALRAVWFPLARSDVGYTNMRHMLSAAVFISAVDSLLNSALILPLLLVIGGMTLWSTTDTEVDVKPVDPGSGLVRWRAQGQRGRYAA
jgi:hypothetical protein